ncbi:MULTISPECIES: bifunctional riboflavin kinase/FAD synthetase [unclassified Sphingomonas]|uniref:bifunctional riboflavin kinase/FAD synthetase n=1 Tax=unclassified Sphingomonas TaxID=196159 RepID=UPI000700D9B3|nr:MULTISPECIES: bifunctional riboflavin kinase/FAD synthetase [unclassified Sphingomonas]KQX17689.1 riboflavin biosynthesis protein RibF [Sphingomonas sp. Root1294]KQY70615.1 riboflavin biosynthesis protein RibF [Sphingomonas sp. Root50]KRB91894.1 riboflavin biosynthesis protein RibF [Sphingomonas sp. Root720]
MERLTCDRPVPAHLRGGVVALGNFDGFHRGHQAVVGAAVAHGRATGRPVLVASFDPHPVRFFRPDAPPFRLTLLDQRAALFAEAGADAMLVFRFDAALANVGAADFVTEWLIGRAGAAHVVTGEDFTFGKGRTGNVGVLAEIGAAHGLTAQAIGPVSDERGPISSSRIRDALIAGDPAEAARLLSRPFRIQGKVQHGDKLGRTIGFPTANIPLGRYLRPKYGIYAVRGLLPDGRVLQGAANLGIRPTFDPPKELLEAYFFDFAESLYDQIVEIELIAYIRPEAKFDGLEALTAQMDRDCAEAKRILAGYTPKP